MRAAAFLPLCLLGCATGPHASPSTEAKTAITEGNQLFIAAVLVGSGDRVATVFTDDGTILPPTQPGTIHGHAAIAQYWRARLGGAHILEFEITPTEVSVSGDLATEIGTTRMKTQTGDAAPVGSTGRYLAVWHLGGDGHWRIQALCPVPDVPIEH